MMDDREEKENKGIIDSTSQTNDKVDKVEESGKTEVKTKNRSERKFNFSLRNLKNLVLFSVFIVFLISLIITVLSVKSCVAKRFSPVEKEIVVKDEVLSITIDEVKNILQISFLTVPYSGYRVVMIGNDSDKYNDEKYADKIIYVDRSVSKVGIDFEKIEAEDFTIDREGKKIVLVLPAVEILSYQYDTVNSERKIVQDSPYTDSLRGEKSARVHLDIENECRAWIKENCFSYCQEIIKKQLADIFNSFGYTSEITFKEI